MAGFILGTGSGILAAAAVYYTLSTSLHQSVASLRTDLSATSGLLHSTFKPTAPIAASALIGPTYPSQPRFSDTLRQRWNHAISSSILSIRQTNFSAAGLTLFEEAKGLSEKLSGEIKETAQGVEEKIVEIRQVVKSAGEEIERKMEAEKEGDYHALGAGIVGGDLRSREELLTGGREGWVREKREEEERGGRRLV